MPTRWAFEPEVRDILAQLAAGDYFALEQRCGGIRLSAEDLATAVTAYGRHLVSPPKDLDLELDVAAIRNADPPAWSVAVPLHTREEGRSDLTLELTIVAAPPSGFRVELDDLHVL
jgi:hypothetical protein